MLHQDDFVKPIDQIPQIKGITDWEHPDSIDWPEWSKATKKASEQYEYVIAEGIFVFHNEQLTQQMHHRILLSLDQEKFINRRKKEDRWGQEPDWYFVHVWESHLLYGTPPEMEGYLKYHHISTSDYHSILTEILS